MGSFEERSDHRLELVYLGRRRLGDYGQAREFEDHTWVPERVEVLPAEDEAPARGRSVCRRTRPG